MLQVHRTARGFLPPDTGLEPTTGYVPARPVKIHWRKRSVDEMEMNEEGRVVGVGPRAGPDHSYVNSTSSTGTPSSDGTRDSLVTGAGLSDVGESGSPIKVRWLQCLPACSHLLYPSDVHQSMPHHHYIRSLPERCCVQGSWHHYIRSLLERCCVQGSGHSLC